MGQLIFKNKKNKAYRIMQLKKIFEQIRKYDFTVSNTELCTFICRNFP